MFGVHRPTQIHSRYAWAHSHIYPTEDIQRRDTYRVDRHQTCLWLSSVDRYARAYKSRNPTHPRLLLFLFSSLSLSLSRNTFIGGTVRKAAIRPLKKKTPLYRVRSDPVEKKCRRDCGVGTYVGAPIGGCGWLGHAPNFGCTDISR